MLPVEFGKYRIIAQIGHGGMADVYLGCMRGPAGARFSKLVVIKCLRRHLAANRDLEAMLIDEASIAARLNHPNVIQTLEVGEANGQYFLALEFLDGQPLNKIKRRARMASNPMPLGMHCRVLCDVLAGLHHAHELRDYDGTELNVVHRDVTPHNVFITYDGLVKVVDFGIAKAAHRLTETAPGVVKGKLRYMAPEQAKARDHDRRVDVFAVGVMLWEAVTSTPFWQGLDDIAIIHRFAAGDVPSSPRAAGFPVPKELDRICRRALAFSRDDRYPTAQAFQVDLEEFVISIDSKSSTGGVAGRGIGGYVAGLFQDRRSELQQLLQRELSEIQWGDPLVRQLFAPESTRGNMSLDKVPSVNGRAERRPADIPVMTTVARRRLGTRLGAWIVLAGACAATIVLVTPKHKSPASQDDAAMTQRDIQLRIAATPSDARLSIDHEPVVGNPFARSVPRDGKVHTIRAAAPGFDDIQRDIVFDQDVSIEFALHPAASAVPVDAAGSSTPMAAPSPKKAPKSRRSLDPRDPWAD